MQLLDEAMARLPDRFKGKPNRYLTGSVERIKKFILDYDRSYYESHNPGSIERILRNTQDNLNGDMPRMKKNPLALGPLIGDSVSQSPFADVENYPNVADTAMASSMADDAITNATRQNAKMIAAHSAAAVKARSAGRTDAMMSSDMANDIVNSPNTTSGSKMTSELSSDLANNIVSSVPQSQASSIGGNYDTKQA